ncbi:MAG: asparagine synthase (glutamine-hydrolyzing) [Bacilli bacterium]
MCGLCGYVNYNKDISNYENNVIQMNETLKYRGPDSFGTFFHKNGLLAHRRLSVLDVDNGSQPMSYDDLTIIYNGEIFNTEELKKDLIEKGYKFNTHCDTEVILKGYHFYKDSILNKLNGMFAFVIFNKTTCFIARDRFGIKPLFYKLHDNGIIFGSEIKAILKHNEVDAIIDRKGLNELLTLSPSTVVGSGVFKDINSLKPGHFLIHTKDKTTIKQYFKLKSKQHTESFEETTKKVKKILTDAIKIRLNSDVALATFLSGGIDSSIITAIASANKNNLTTYSIDYEDNNDYFVSDNYTISQDDYFINIMKNKFNLNHKKIIISIEDLTTFLEEATIARDLPGMADIDSSLLWFSTKIKENHTVCLSGECADEIFFGYPWFYKEELTNLETFPWILNTKERQKLIKDELNIDIESNLKKYYEKLISEVEYDNKDSNIDKKYRRLMYLNLNNFMTTLLDRKDRMTMRAGLEVRVPFSDYRLIEYLWNVPYIYKNKDGIEKNLLRNAFKDILPIEIFKRKKTPYPKTFNPKYTNMVIEKLKEALEDNSSALHIVFKKDEIQNLIDTKGEKIQNPWFGQLMKGPSLLAYLYQFHIWAKIYNVKFQL